MNRKKSLSVFVCFVLEHADLQQVAPLMDLLDVFIGEDAAGSLQLALALSRSSGDDGFMQTEQNTQRNILKSYSIRMFLYKLFI